MDGCENNEHEYEWIDESFDHEFGTEQRGHWECEFCGHISDDTDPPELEPLPDSVF